MDNICEVKSSIHVGYKYYGQLYFRQEQFLHLHFA